MFLRSRRFAVSVAAIVTSLLASGVHAMAAPCWQPPVPAPVIDPFREPACRWCPGNRGLEYATSTGDRVVSVATGRVTFAGSVAGSRFVVVRHRDGLRVTYGSLAPNRWRRGDLVVAGTTVGRSDGHLHLGVRDGERYIDPAPFIGRFRYRARLVPTDGSAGRAAPPPRLVCATPGPSDSASRR